jgi:hypothetical protein
MFNEDLSALVLPSFQNLKPVQEVEAVEKHESVAVKSHKTFALSASRISKICTENGGEFLSTAAMRAIEEGFKARFNDAPFERKSNRACDHGNENEQLGLDAFIQQSGFALSGMGENQATFTYGEHVVAHPDATGYINGELDFLVEVKCPFNQDVFESYFAIKGAADLKEIAPNYYWQIACQQLAADCYKSYFVAFDPRHETKNLHFASIFIPREDIAFLKNRIALAEDYLSSLENENAKAVAFQKSVAPIAEIEQLPSIDLDVGFGGDVSR